MVNSRKSFLTVNTETMWTMWQSNLDRVEFTTEKWGQYRVFPFSRMASLLFFIIFLIFIFKGKLRISEEFSYLFGLKDKTVH